MALFGPDQDIETILGVTAVVPPNSSVEFLTQFEGGRELCLICYQADAAGQADPRLPLFKRSPTSPWHCWDYGNGGLGSGSAVQYATPMTYRNNGGAPVTLVLAGFVKIRSWYEMSPELEWEEDHQSLSDLPIFLLSWQARFRFIWSRDAFFDPNENMVFATFVQERFAYLSPPSPPPEGPPLPGVG
jgi:hypothetical protein